jgi:hypothetical protein
MKEGTVVLVTGPVSANIREVDKEVPVYGTYLGEVSEKRVVVLLSNGDLYLGPKYSIIKVEELDDDGAGEE